MWRPGLFVAALLLGGCVDQHVPNAGSYVDDAMEDAMPVTFLPDTARLTPESRAALLSLKHRLPPGATLMLLAGDRVEDRASAVASALGLDVSLPAVPDDQLSRTDRAELVVTSRRLLPTECFAPGQPVPRDNWPGDDDTRARTLPPGCAVANALQQMVVDKRDLVRGRTLAPGAALPVARAIERYYNREIGPGSATTGPPAPSLGPGASTPASLPDSTGAAPDGAGLLQGPLTPGGTAGAATAGPMTGGATTGGAATGGATTGGQ